ncbi:MAG TPA: ABC transporter ATP-binding protein [Vicinamibacterales bacterium]|nr:ABC transporter ATP-binding protein [Vicinamibacterales bacterium]
MLKLFRLIKPYRGYVAIVLVLGLAQSIGFLLLPRLMSDIVDKGIVKGDQRAILEIGGLMLLMSIVATLCAIAGSFFSSKVATGFGRILRGAIFARVEHFSIHQFDRFGAASLVTRTTNDTTQVQQMLIMMLTMVITAPMMAIGGVILALSQDAQLAWVLIAAMPPMAIVFGLIMRGATPLSQAMQLKIDRLNLVLGEGLSGVRVIRAFDRGAHQRDRFDQANLDLTNTAISVNRLIACLMPALIVMLNLTSVAIIWFGSHRIDQGTMQVGAMIASLQYAMQILFAVFMVTAMFVMLPRASASAARINEVLGVEFEIVDPAAPKAPLSAPQRGFVEFQDVTFQYPGAEEPALTGVSFTAHPGEVTAIVGGTGSGKSTLAGLIPRFYDVNHGRVLVDGMDVREMPQADLRARIGFVPQKAVLFTGTVSANIRYGREDASDEEVRHAATVAQALEFVDAMPEKFASPIAQGGVNLSGGQKQRLAIARAVVRRPDIYVFDDSFSALDLTTDARLRAALKVETANATVFVVAQRISTVINADRIVVLDNGRVVGVGTHAELLERSDTYREIVESQASLEEVA